MDRRIQRPKGLRKSFGKIRLSLPALILESVLISFGVLLAFGVDSWKAERRLREDTFTVLENLKNELLSNRTLVLEYLSYHDSLIVRLGELKDKIGPQDRLDREALETLYHRPTVSYILQNIAWETAHSTQVIGQFEYLTTYNLTHCYVSQSAIQETRSFLKSKLYEYAPAGNTKATTTTVRMIFEELSDQEQQLLGIYRDALLSLDNELVERGG